MNSNIGWFKKFKTSTISHLWKEDAWYRVILVFTRAVYQAVDKLSGQTQCVATLGIRRFFTGVRELQGIGSQGAWEGGYSRPCSWSFLLKSLKSQWYFISCTFACHQSWTNRDKSVVCLGERFRISWTLFQRFWRMEACAHPFLQVFWPAWSWFGHESDPLRGRGVWQVDPECCLFILGSLLVKSSLTDFPPAARIDILVVEAQEFVNQ